MSKTVNPNLKRFTYALIPLFLIMIGTVGSIYYTSQAEKVDLTDQYLQQVNNQQKQTVANLQSNFDDIYERWDTSTKAIQSKMGDTLTANETTSIQSYFHNTTIDRPTPAPGKNKLYNGTVDFSVSSYSVFANYTGFGNWSQSVERLINVTSALDIFLPSLFQLDNDILWINLILEDGVKRTYPFKNGIDSNFTTSQYEWYQNRTAAFQIGDESPILTDPHFDHITGNLVVTMAIAVEVQQDLQGILGIDFVVDSFQNIVDQQTSEKARSFVHHPNFGILSHSSLNQSTIIQTQVATPIIAVEDNSTAFASLLNTSKSEFVHTTLTYMNSSLYTGEQMISLFYNEQLGVIFGHAQSLPSAAVVGGFDLLDLFLYPFIILVGITALMVLFLRKFGFLRGISLEDLQSLKVPTRSDLKEQLDRLTSAENVVDDIAKIGANQISKKGMELRKKLKEFSDTGIEQVLNQLEASAKERLEQADDPLEEKLNILTEKLENINQFNPEDIQERLEKFKPDQIMDGNLNFLLLLEDDTAKLEKLMEYLPPDVDVDQLAKVMDVKRLVIASWAESLPEEYGIAHHGNILQFDQQKVKQHKEEIINSLLDAAAREMEVDKDSGDPSMPESTPPGI